MEPGSMDGLRDEEVREIAAQRESVRHRLVRMRWVILMAAFILFLMALAESSRILLAGLGFLAIVLVVLVIPQPAATAPGAALRDGRSKPWPEPAQKALAQALSFPVYIFDTRSVLRFANDPAVRTFGQAVIGEPLSLTFRRPELAALVARAISEGGTILDEYREIVPTERSFEVTIAPIPGRRGSRPDLFLMTFRDLTAMRRAEQMRSDFIANASHELRTPLASLRGFIETIKGPAARDPKAIARFLDIMLDQSERMSRLIDDLLSLSRIEQKAHLRPTGKVRLDDVLAHVAGSLQPLAERLSMTIDIDRQMPAMEVIGDRDELFQVFQNLVENACKYGQSGKRVEIIARPLDALRPGDPGRIEVIVRDFGPGIAAEHLPRLTERFYRVDVGTSRQQQGTGLGLAIVKHILNRHALRMTVASTVGEGSAFSIIFPLLSGPSRRTDTASGQTPGEGVEGRLLP